MFARRVELALFLQEHQHCNADCFENSEFIFIFLYMTDMLSIISIDMWGDGVDVMEAEENLKVFKKTAVTMEITNRE